MEHYFEAEFDFSQLDPEELKRIGNVTFSELESVIRSSRTWLDNAPGWPLWEYYYCAVGISRNSRIFFILLKYENDKFGFKDVNFAYEEDIEKFWCQGRRR